MFNPGLFAILLSAAAGGALVLHAARAWPGGFGEAGSGAGPLMVALIGAAFALGLLELAARNARALARTRAIRALPGTLPDEASVATALTGVAQPWLRSALEAALQGRPAPGEPAGFTGTLLSLLVMLGLLGTFLGFVDTLSGAREVLSRSSDLAAIRDGLTSPLSGLSRSFSTSLAGLSTSAALAVALAVVRRAEGRAQAAWAGYVAGPLARHTPTGRALLALERVSRQGDALPEAALALVPALTAAATQAGERLTAAAEARFERLADRLAALMEGQATRAAEAVSTLSRSVEQGLERVSAAEAERGATLGRHVEALVARVEASMDRLALAEETRATAQGARMQALAVSLGAALEHLAEAEGTRATAQEARMQALAVTLGAALERTAEAEATLATAQESRMQALAASVAGHWEALADRVALVGEGALQVEAALRQAGEVAGRQTLELAAALSTQVEHLQAALSREAERFLDARLARADEAARVLERLERAQTEHLGAMSAHLGALGERLAGPLTEVARAAEAAPRLAAQLVTDAGVRLEGAQAAEGARIAALDALLGRLSALSAHVEAGSEAGARRWSEAMSAMGAAAEAIETRAEGRLTALATTFTEQARVQAAGVETTGALVQEAADLVRAGGAELSAVAEMFADAVDRYRASSDAWRQTLGSLEDALGRAPGGSAGAGQGDVAALMATFVDQTREIFAETLRFQRELFAELRALRGAQP